MSNIKVTLRNYRCFEDQTPASVEIGPGFTAFVGQNNSGKSSMLKAFYELRPLLQRIGATGNFQNLLNGADDSIAMQGLYDQADIFCDNNTRPLEIQFDFAPTNKPSPLALTRAVFIKERVGLAWRGNFPCGENNKQWQSVAGGPIIGFKECCALSQGGNGVDCSVLFEFAQTFANSIYIGPFRNAINQGSGQYFDIQIGDSFVSVWDAWKVGNSRAQNRAINRVIADIQHIFNFNGLEITATPDKKTLHLSVDGYPHKLNELGAGIAHFIIVLGNTMIRKPDYVLIDEPELSLHPSLQIDFLTTLASYAKRGVIFATHSLGLARSVAERIYTFQRKDGAVTVSPFEQTPHYSEFLGEMSFSGFKELGCDGILFVEGVTDVRTAHQFLRKLGKDHKIVVLPLGGNQLIRSEVEIELAELKRMSSNVSVLIDSECEDEGSLPNTERQKFTELCKKLGFKVCMTQRRAIENYLSDKAIKSIMGPMYSMLTPYQKLSESPNPWGKHENWRIAREMEFEELQGTDVGKFFAAL